MVFTCKDKPSLVFMAHLNHNAEIREDSSHKLVVLSGGHYPV